MQEKETNTRVGQDVIGILFIGMKQSTALNLITNNQTSLQMLFIILGIASILISIVLVYFISKSISRPIVSVSETLEDYANYDFTNRKQSKYINRNILSGDSSFW